MLSRNIPGKRRTNWDTRYRIYRNDDTKNSKGILLAVRNSIKTISIEVSRYDEVGQTL